MKVLLTLIIAVLCFAMCSMQLEIEPGLPPPTRWRERHGIPSELFNTFKLMSQYAEAAYCPNNVIGLAGDPVACDSGNCPLVEGQNTTIISKWHLTDYGFQATGYLALDHTNKYIILTFRGPVIKQDWKEHHRIRKESLDLCFYCYAHTGYYFTWFDSRELGQVEEILGAVADMHPDYQIVTTGHSTGGAVATLAAAELRERGFRVEMYSFGAPRSTNEDLAQFINDQGDNYRITHYNDAMPHYPPLKTSFEHISPEFYIRTPNGAIPTEKDVIMLEGPKNLKGNYGWLGSPVDRESHWWYFGRMTTKCYRSAQGPSWKKGKNVNKVD